MRRGGILEMRGRVCAHKCRCAFWSAVLIWVSWAVWAVRDLVSGRQKVGKSREKLGGFG